MRNSETATYKTATMSRIHLPLLLLLSECTSDNSSPSAMRLLRVSGLWERVPSIGQYPEQGVNPVEKQGYSSGLAAPERDNFTLFHGQQIVALERCVSWNTRLKWVTTVLLP